MSDTRGIGQPRKPDWRDHADCRKPGMDPELWFPKGTTGPYVLQAAEAKAFCRECPVALTCARWALKMHLTDGIYGGLTEGQRSRMAAKPADETDALIKAAWKRDGIDRQVEVYLANSIQGDDGHVWWRRRSRTITAAGRVLTPAQLAFEVGYGRRPQGHVKATCGQPFCVAAEHLGDSRDRRRPMAAGLGRSA